jgi:hypothetical protein
MEMRSARETPWGIMQNIEIGRRLEEVADLLEAQQARKSEQYGSRPYQLSEPLAERSRRAVDSKLPERTSRSRHYL